MDSSIFYENLRTRLAERIGAPGAHALESLGVLSEDEIVKCGTPLDTISTYLSKRLQLGKSIRKKQLSGLSCRVDFLVRIICN